MAIWVTKLCTYIVNSHTNHLVYNYNKIIKYTSPRLNIKERISSFIWRMSEIICDYLPIVHWALVIKSVHGCNW